MAKVIVLALASEQQLSFQFCGPAAMRMILSAFGVTESQNALWAAVEAHSAGGTQVPTDGSLWRLFPKQVCHRCGNWFCWYTTPEAMALTIAERVPAGQSASAAYPGTRDTTIVRLLSSLERMVRFPPAATIRGSNHWVVMNGYHLDDLAFPGAPPVTIDKWSLNGVYYLNPGDGPVPVVTFAATAAWKTMLKSLDCGPEMGNYPVVVGRNPLLILFTWWKYLLIAIRRWPWPPWGASRGPRPLPPS